MRSIGKTFALLLWLLLSWDAACAEKQDPYDEESQATYEERVKMLSDKAKATLAILEKVKFEKIELRMDRPYETFEVLRKQLELHGVTVRLKNYGEKQQPREGAIPLVNIPIGVFMKYFDQAVGWGWIVYEDGSITYFDNVCSGNHPKDGVFCHKSQFEAGKPETMAKEQERDPLLKKEGEQDGTGQPATRPESKSEGNDKPQPEAEGRSR
jgi:hypothetical protein